VQALYKQKDPQQEAGEALTDFIGKQKSGGGKTPPPRQNFRL